MVCLKQQAVSMLPSCNQDLVLWNLEGHGKPFAGYLTPLAPRCTMSQPVAAAKQNAVVHIVVFAHLYARFCCPSMSPVSMQLLGLMEQNQSQPMKLLPCGFSKMGRMMSNGRKLGSCDDWYGIARHRTMQPYTGRQDA